MKMIIAGSRTITDYEWLKSAINSLPKEIEIIEIVSGTANGVDKLGEKYAAEMNIPVKRFPANWDKFGKRAGYLRNVEMADYADAALIFWDGKSKGTKHMIDIMQNKMKSYWVITYVTSSP